MSLSTEINIAGRVPDPQRLAEQLSERNLNPVIGHGVVMLLKEHFLMLNEERHGRFPGNTTGFYETAADATFYTNDEGDPKVVVSEPVGLRQRLEGGMIQPKDKKYLAIPNYEYLDVTHGKSPTEFDNLTLLYGYQDTGQIGPIGLITKQGGLRARGTGQQELFDKNRNNKPVKRGGEFTDSGKSEGIGEGEVLFWLKMFVFQEPDPSVIPTKGELEQAGYEAAALYLGRGFTTGFIPENTPD